VAVKDIGPAGRMWNLYKAGGLTPAITAMLGGQNAQQMAYIRSMIKLQRKQSPDEIRLDQMTSAVFDLETTGFSAYNGDEIISIGAVKMEGGVVAEPDTFYSLARPASPIPDRIVVLTGITNDEATQAPALIETLSAFLNYVGNRVLIVHGSGHDRHFLNAALWKTAKISVSHRFLDTLMIAKWLFPEWGRYDLDYLLCQYGIRLRRRHHALEDALMTADLWGSMLPELTRKGITSLGDLYARLA
jgi:DNA polymerase-3 subunit epsilon